MTDLTVTGDLVLNCCQLIEPHRSAGVQLLRADADLGAEAEDPAIGKPGGGVDVDAGGIDPLLEGPAALNVIGDDDLRVVSTVVVDVVDGIIEESTTLTAMIRSLYSVSQSSVVAA